MINLIPPKAPALPLAEQEYTRAFKDRYSNVLRLYFNQIDSLIQALLGTNGGKFLQLAHISALSFDNQYAPADNIKSQITFSTVGSNSGFTILSGTATANSPGVYKLDYNLQLVNTDIMQRNAYVWIEANGADIVGSSREFTITTLGAVVAQSSFEIALNVNDEIKVWWATDKAYNPVGAISGVYLEAIPAQVSPYARPSNPSAIGSITYVSRLA